MKIAEITEYVRKYVHPDVEKQLQKYEKRHRNKIRMGYGPGVMAYPYRVEGKKWSKKYKKSIKDYTFSIWPQIVFRCMLMRISSLSTMAYRSR